MSTLMPQSVAFGLPASNAMSPTNANAAKTPTPTSAATYKVPKFLRSLYSILQHEDTSVVTWLQNQELKPNRVTAFHILDLDRFENEVLPKYFKHSKFASFQRQLNNFGFRKWTKTQSSGVCTFSHNCFPPDPREIGVLRASIREQWRQKNTDSRRRVGNGITKAERKLQQQVQQQVQQLQLPVTKPSSDKTNKLAESTPTPTGSPAPPTTTNANANTMASPTRVESFSEMLKTPLAPTHQPQVKKLARGDWVSSNAAMDAAFADSPAKPTHHLPHVSYNNTVNIGSSAPTPTPTFAHHHVPLQSPMMIVTEPWGWHHQAMPAYDVHPAFHHHQHHPHQHVGAANMDMWASPPVRKGVYCHPPEQQVSPSAMEEFTFDSLLLFAE